MFLFWLTHSEVDSVEWRRNDQVLCSSFEKSRESVWFSVLTTNI